MICVYAAVGQKASSVARVIEAVRQYGAPERCLFVIGEANAAPGLQWLTPYAGLHHGRIFHGAGPRRLLVIDDLTKHAAAYRQLSLLLRRPPGREAYPGDIFYIHSRLLGTGGEARAGARRRLAHGAADRRDRRPAISAPIFRPI